MGCGAPIDMNLTEFQREALGFKSFKRKGLDLDNEKNFLAFENKGSLNFREEIITHADESAPVKPWLEHIIPPDVPLEEDLSYPKYNLKIHHIFGFRTENCRKNLFYLSNDQILYTSSSLAIIQNIDDRSQTIFGGFPMKESKECHDDTITSMAFLRDNVSMIATGQSGIWPKILVWSPIDPDVIYAKFEQPKGSAQVSALAFDKRGHYLASFGKDDLNSFYIFDLRTKTMYMSERSGGRPDQYLLDLAFNPVKDELCLVGYQKIIYVFIPLKSCNNKYKKGKIKEGSKTFTSVCYINGTSCLIGSEEGKIYLYEDTEKKKSKRLSDGSIQVIVYNPKFSQPIISDSLGYVYLFNVKKFSDKACFKMECTVKSLDESEDQKILMGLRNGDIVIKDLRDPTKHEETFMKNHCTGTINDLTFVPEYKAMTIGNDGFIYLWNLRSKKSESYGQVNLPPIIGLVAVGTCITYNPTDGRVAIGKNNGTVSIRKGIKMLDTEEYLENINQEGAPIITLKYSPYGDNLLVSSQNGEIAILSVADGYRIINEIKMDSPIENFDWDIEGNYIQANNAANQYIFKKVLKSEVVKEEKELKNIEWSSITCKFNYTVQGIYQGSTNPDFISAVSKANTKKLLSFGNDDYLLSLCNYPCITENPKIKKYRGHSGKIKLILWLNEDSRLLTIAENDKTMIYWIIEEENLENES